MRPHTLITLVLASVLALTPRARAERVQNTSAVHNPAVAQSPDDWSNALVTSTLARYPDATKFGGWGYARALYLFGQYLVYKRTHDARYLDYLRQWVDTHIDEKGELDRKIDALDYILPANLLIILYDETGDARYQKALAIFRRRFDDYPCTKDGGFWHATVQSRQHHSGLTESLWACHSWCAMGRRSAIRNMRMTRQSNSYSFTTRT